MPKLAIKRDQNRLNNAVGIFPPEIREAFLAKNYPEALKQFSLAIASGEPWALTAYLRLASEPAQQQLIIHLHSKLGVQDEDELRQLVEGGRQLSELQYMDTDDKILACERYLAAEYAADPERRRRSLLFSHAEVIDDVPEIPQGNGHVP